MTTATQHTTLTAEQLVEMLRLSGSSDSVELKLTVPAADRRATAAALEVDPLGAQIRQVVFFDTPDLTLNQHGIVVRARRVQARGDDSVVKLRPVVPTELPGKLRKSPDFKVEVDAMPGGFVCSGSYKGTLGQNDVKEVLMGRRPVRKLFSKEQRAFFADHAPAGIELDDLAVLGPLSTTKLKFQPTGLKRKLVAEMWLYPDGSQIIELSTKCTPAETIDVATETREFLADRGVNLEGEQQTKTKTALEFFVRELRGEACLSPGARHPRTDQRAPARDPTVGPRSAARTVGAGTSARSRQRRMDRATNGGIGWSGAASSSTAIWWTAGAIEGFCGSFSSAASARPNGALSLGRPAPTGAYVCTTTERTNLRCQGARQGPSCRAWVR